MVSSRRNCSSKILALGCTLTALHRFSTRNEVSRANSRRLEELKAPPRGYRALDTPGYDNAGRPVQAEAMKKLLERLVAQKDITLKEGAQVMLIKVRIFSLVLF